MNWEIKKKNVSLLLPRQPEVFLKSFNELLASSRGRVRQRVTSRAAPFDQESGAWWTSCETSQHKRCSCNSAGLGQSKHRNNGDVCGAKTSRFLLPGSYWWWCLLWEEPGRKQSEAWVQQMQEITPRFILFFLFLWMESNPSRFLPSLWRFNALILFNHAARLALSTYRCFVPSSGVAGGVFSMGLIEMRKASVRNPGRVARSQFRLQCL